jgi:hypothetical protein
MSRGVIVVAFEIVPASQVHARTEALRRDWIWSVAGGSDCGRRSDTENFVASWEFPQFEPT